MPHATYGWTSGGNPISFTITQGENDPDETVAEWVDRCRRTVDDKLRDFPPDDP